MPGLHTTGLRYCCRAESKPPVFPVSTTSLFHLRRSAAASRSRRPSSRNCTSQTTRLRLHAGAHAASVRIEAKDKLESSCLDRRIRFGSREDRRQTPLRRGLSRTSGVVVSPSWFAKGLFRSSSKVAQYSLKLPARALSADRRDLDAAEPVDAGLQDGNVRGEIESAAYFG